MSRKYHYHILFFIIFISSLFLTNMGTACLPVDEFGNIKEMEVGMSYPMGQLVIPSIVFGFILILAITSISHNRNREGWVWECLVGFVLTGVGCLWGLFAQVLYVFEEVLKFFGTGKYYEYPNWFGGTVGGALGLLTGVWFVQHLRSWFKEGQSKVKIAAKGFLVGLLYSTTVHMLLMMAYRKTDYRFMLGVAITVIGTGFATGLITSVVCILAYTKALLRSKRNISVINNPALSKENDNSSIVTEAGSKNIAKEIELHNCQYCGVQGMLLMSDGRCPNCIKFINNKSSIAQPSESKPHIESKSKPHVVLSPKKEVGEIVKKLLKLAKKPVSNQTNKEIIQLGRKLELIPKISLNNNLVYAYRTALEFLGEKDAQKIAEIWKKNGWDVRKWMAEDLYLY